MKSSTSRFRHIQVGNRVNGDDTRRLIGQLPHVAVDGGGVRPVCLHGNDSEAVMLDQAPGDGGAGAIELRRAVRGLAQQNDARRCETVECTRRRPDRRARAAARLRREAH